VLLAVIAVPAPLLTAACTGSCEGASVGATVARTLLVGAGVSSPGTAGANAGAVVLLPAGVGVGVVGCTPAVWQHREVTYDRAHSVDASTLKV
jgi:hypothetical protein